MIDGYIELLTYFLLVSTMMFTLIFWIHFNFFTLTYLVLFLDNLLIYFLQILGLTIEPRDPTSDDPHSLNDLMMI